MGLLWWLSAFNHPPNRYRYCCGSLMYPLIIEVEMIDYQAHIAKHIQSISVHFRNSTPAAIIRTGRINKLLKDWMLTLDSVICCTDFMAFESYYNLCVKGLQRLVYKWHRKTWCAPFACIECPEFLDNGFLDSWEMPVTFVRQTGNAMLSHSEQWKTLENMNNYPS